ncbi:MAG TPA: hypothetical protein VGA37_12300 [Gemmatimonadales bacterium]
MPLRAGGATLAADDMDWARDRYDRMHFQVRPGQRVLTIESEPIRTNWREYRGRRGLQVTVEVTVPAAVSLNVQTGDGDVTVGDVTSDGDITVGIVESNGIALETGDGDVSIAAPASFRADFDIEGEDVSLGRAFRVEGRVTSRGAPSRSRSPGTPRGTPPTS